MLVAITVYLGDARYTWVSFANVIVLILHVLGQPYNLLHDNIAEVCSLRQM